MLQGGNDNNSVPLPAARTTPSPVDIDDIRTGKSGTAARERVRGAESSTRIALIFFVLGALAGILIGQVDDVHSLVCECGIHVLYHCVKQG